MTRKQRIQSAELRRLDHIARSLDRIGEAMEHLHCAIVSGNNDRVVTIAGNVEGHAQLAMSDILQTVGRDGDNIIQGNDNTLTTGDNSPINSVNGVKMSIGRGVGLNTGATTIDAGSSQNFNDEVSGGNQPMGDIKHLPHNPGTG